MLIEPSREIVPTVFVYALLIQSQNDTAALKLYSENTDRILRITLVFKESRGKSLESQTGIEYALTEFQ